MGKTSVLESLVGNAAVKARLDSTDSFAVQPDTSVPPALHFRQRFPATRHRHRDPKALDPAASTSASGRTRICREKSGLQANGRCELAQRTDHVGCLQERGKASGPSSSTAARGTVRILRPLPAGTFCLSLQICRQKFGSCSQGGRIDPCSTARLRRFSDFSDVRREIEAETARVCNGSRFLAEVVRTMQDVVVALRADALPAASS